MFSFLSGFMWVYLTASAVQAGECSGEIPIDICIAGLKRKTSSDQVSLSIRVLDLYLGR